MGIIDLVNYFIKLKIRLEAVNIKYLLNRV